MKTIFPTQTLFLATMLLLAACTTVTPTQPAAALEPGTPLPGPTEAAPAAPARPSEAPTDAALTASPPAVSEALYLRVLWPEEGSLISVAEIELVGEAPPGAVVSIGEEILIVPADGGFRQVIRLEEGPNAIEIVASNQAGEEQSLIFTIVYEP